MMIKLLLIFLALFVSHASINAQGLIIQEHTDNIPGICTMDGKIDSTATNAGYTGIGYVDVDNGLGIGMSWSFYVPAAGSYDFNIRYSLGGSDETSRNAKVLVNGTATDDTLKFPYTDLWSNWISTDTLTVDLVEGTNNIRLVSTTIKGLANIDYFHIFGTGITTATCLPSFTLSVISNDKTAGDVSYTPIQEYYDYGTEVTVTATPNSGYFFHSWSGEGASINASNTFTIERNTIMEALFYPYGTKMVPEAMGYATIQHKNGTPYLLTGGSLGTTVQANSFEELKTYLSAEEPYVVEVSRKISGVSGQEIKISSNKTLIGTNQNAHIEGITSTLEEARNVIIKNMTFSKVLTLDALEINSQSKNVWIDHCEFFSEYGVDINKDKYDGLLDIKNQSTFLTISNTEFHHHQKSILISSGSSEYADTVIRATFHHNYFHDCGSRLPSFRFGKGHIFNNYYENIGTGINSRIGACIRVEKNYFKNADSAAGTFYTNQIGGLQMIDNLLENAPTFIQEECFLNVPYDYSAFLEETTNLADSILKNVGPQGDSLITSYEELVSQYQLRSFPNPANEKLTISFRLHESSNVSVKILDIIGNEIIGIAKGNYSIGRNNIEINTSELNTGMYFYQLKTGDITLSKRFIIE